MQPIQIVIDTNVLVAAYRSRYGASYALVSRMGDPLFQINVSTALLYEYEAKLKNEVVRAGGRDFESQETFLDYLAAIAIRRRIYFRFRAEFVDSEDQFVVDLAIASRARYIITFNQRHFLGVRQFGVDAIRPGDFLTVLEEQP